MGDRDGGGLVNFPSVAQLAVVAGQVLNGEFDNGRRDLILCLFYEMKGAAKYGPPVIFAASAYLCGLLNANVSEPDRTDS
jgi:hypothetical protein